MTVVDLTEFWTELCSCRARIVMDASTDEAFVFGVDRCPKPAATHRDDTLTWLQELLTGTSLMELALKHAQPPSAISNFARQARRKMEVIERRRLPSVLLVAAAHAAKGRTTFKTGSGYDREINGRLLQFVQLRRFDGRLRDTLTASEFQTIRLRVDGLTIGEIAEKRRTATRATANQLTSAFRKLGVSGRAELLALLLRAEGSYNSNSNEQPLR